MISRISTFVTLTPQRSVTSSSFARRSWLISSRLASTSSRGMSPTTARRGGAGEVRHLHDAHLRIEHLVERDEIDRDRRVVLGDRVLSRYLEEELAKIHVDGLVDERDQDHRAGPLGTEQSAEPEHDEPLVLPHYPDRLGDQGDHEQQQNPKADQQTELVHVTLLRSPRPATGLPLHRLHGGPASPFPYYAPPWLALYRARRTP